MTMYPSTQNWTVSALAMIALSSLGGCVSAHSRGVVAMKITDTEAHVCVGKESVHTGSLLDVYRNDCGKVKRSCEFKKVGRGTVTDVLNEHYSVAEFPAAVAVREGDLIEVVK